MRRSTAQRRWLPLPGVLLLLALGQVWAATTRADPVVVANPNVPVAHLERSSLRAIFGMKHRSWPDGTRIEVFVLADKHPVHVEFSKKVLGIFPHNLRRVWDRQVYSGTGQSPREVGSEQEMIELVGRTRNAIGYLRDARNSGDIKVITTR